ncbi:MAG: hypothetical protein OXM59_05810 [Gammaproteobacteria bacterium]|nr:hypothetical protein [Gammaproteobacteria bacterium]
MWRISPGADFVVVNDGVGIFFRFAQRNGEVSRIALRFFGGLAGGSQLVAKRRYLVAQRPGFLGAAFRLGSGVLAQLLHFKPNSGDFVAQNGSVPGSTPDFLVRSVAHGPHILAQGGNIVAEITGLVKCAFKLGNHRRAPVVRSGASFGLVRIVRTGAPRRDQHPGGKRTDLVSD